MEAAGFLKKRLGDYLETAPFAPLLGPAPAPRVRGRYVFHLILRAPEPGLLRDWLSDLPPPKGTRLRLDPDPVGFAELLED